MAAEPAPSRAHGEGGVADPTVARTRRGYALGSVATGAFGTVPGLLLLPYLTERLGIASAVAGLVVLLPKAWDVVLNPIAGRISDRSASPQGPRRPFLLRGGVALSACFVLLFAGPAAPPGVATAWVLVAFVACATAYAFFQVPYVAMPAEITDDPLERTRIMMWRVAVLALAILVSGASAPAIRDAVGPERGYLAVGFAIGLLILLGALGAWWGTRRAPHDVVPVAAGGLADQLRLVARNPRFASLLGTFVVQALGFGAMLAAVDYVAREVLRRPGAGSILFVCFVAPAIVCTPLWQRLSVRWGKKRGYVVATLTFAVGAALAVLAGGVSAAAVYVAVAVAGVGYAGAQMLPLAMLPDVAAQDASDSGQNRAGVFTGVWTAGETLGLALGPALFGLVLAVGGYVSSTDSSAVQPDSAVVAIRLGFSLVPAALAVLSLLLLARYHDEETST